MPCTVPWRAPSAADVERIVFAARPLARRIDERNALCDGAADAGEPRGPHQIGRAFDAQAAVGLLRRRIARCARRARQIRELMDDDIGARCGDGLRHGIGIEHVDHHRRDADRAQGLRLGGRAGGAGDLVIGLAQQAGQPPPDHTGGASEKHVHVATPFNVDDRPPRYDCHRDRARTRRNRTHDHGAGRARRHRCRRPQGPAVQNASTNSSSRLRRRATFKTRSQMFRRIVTRR